MTGNPYQDVFLAILSMDTYLRDWRDLGTNLTNLGDEVGTATVGANSEQLGVVDGSQRLDQTNMFFAQSYIDANGQMIISYRGIEGPTETLNALGIAMGNITDRVQLAAQFYDYVTGRAGATPFTANAIFTGHSMGGALAGIISSVYAKQAVVFDNTGFENVLTRIALNVEGNDPSTISTFYGFLNPGQAIPPINENVSGYAVAGDVAQGVRMLQSAPIVTLYSGSRNSGLGAVQLHDAALVPILTYGNNEVAQDNQWKDAALYVVSNLFNNAIASKIGLQNVTGNQPSYFMRAEIAYSAIDQGAMPYGDTGIASLYADTGTLGALIDASSLTGLVAGTDVLKGMGEIIVQQAADFAASANESTDAAKGAFSKDDNILTINLDPSNWTQSFKTSSSDSSSTTPNILGLGDLVSAVLSNTKSWFRSSDPANAWINDIKGQGAATFAKFLNGITKVEIALGGGNGNISGSGAPGAGDGGNGGALLIGVDGEGSVTGSNAGDDLIVGGQTINTGTGDDIIIADSGHVQLNLNGGTDSKDIIYAGPTLDASITYTLKGAADVPQSGCSASAGQTVIGASPSADLIIGDADGGDTFDFTNAGHAAFTVVWGGNGGDTFNFETDKSDPNAEAVQFIDLSMSGVTASNIGSLDLQKLETYVDSTYGLHAYQSPF